jgi:hypothetical protein
MSDPMQDASEGFLSRINHPVIGAFITSAIIWNWEIVYYLIRGFETTQLTVIFVNSNFINWSNWKNLILYPGIITVGFLLLAPALYEAYSVYKIWWNGFAKKEIPLFKFQYQMVYNNYQNQIDQRDAKIKQEMNNRENQKNQFEAKVSDLELKIQYLENSVYLNQGRTYSVPNYRGFSSAQELLYEFTNTREKVKQLEASIAQSQITKSENLNEIQRLKGEVSNLRSKLPEN